MEDPRILNWRGWSPTRKAQAITTIAALLVTAGFMVFDTLQLTLPHNWLGNQIWGIGMLLEHPANGIARFLGIWETGPRWLIRVLALSVNGVLALIFGTILGGLITMVKRPQHRRNQ